ncbi:MAG: ABC transporter permease subunit/CPBP intramembrane protease [Myxococcales bacterium]|nr:ABC transporter permease subunit/CPBP intramembrane protease [Myxococcales bacterium]
MRLPQILTIFRKELVETLRDRRTLLMMIGLPMLVYPLMAMGLSRLMESTVAATKARRSVVATWGAAPAELVDAMKATDAHLEVTAWLGAPDEVRRSIEAGEAAPAAAVARGAATAHPTKSEQENPTLAAARTLLTSRRADAVLVSWPGLDQALARDDLGTVTLYFDALRGDSRTARDRLADVLSSYRTTLLTRREQARQLPAGFTDALKVLRRDVAPPVRVVNHAMGSALPFILLTLSLLGSFYAAIDMTAGEKERGTMQTLMVAPLRSSEIVMGKVLAVSVVGLVAVAANTASLSLTITRILPAGELSIPPVSIVLAGLMLVPITMTTSPVFLAVAVFARDFKDGQNFLTPVFMAIAMPAGLAILPTVELNAWTAFVPVVNIALLVKAAFSGEARAELVFLVLLSSALFAMLALMLAAHVFGREQIMLGGKESARSVLGLERRAGGVPTPAVALTTFALAMVLAFYASLLVEARGVVTTLLVVQYGFFLLPALVVVFGLGYSARETLLLRLPSWQHLLAAVVIGATGWIAIVGVFMRVAPPPESLVKGLEQMLTLGDPSLPLWVVLLGVAVTPAICEELFFRGVMLSGLRRLGLWPAVLISSLLFGFAHASIYRMLPTLALGLMLAALAWRSGSILPSMIVHAMNNGLIVWVVRHPSSAGMLGVSETSTLPPLSVTVAATLLCAAGVGLAWKAPGRAPQ